HALLHANRATCVGPGSSSCGFAHAVIDASGREHRPRGRRFPSGSTENHQGKRAAETGGGRKGGGLGICLQREGVLFMPNAERKVKRPKTEMMLVAPPTHLPPLQPAPTVTE